MLLAKDPHPGESDPFTRSNAQAKPSMTRNRRLATPQGDDSRALDTMGHRPGHRQTSIVQS